MILLAGACVGAEAPLGDVGDATGAPPSDRAAADLVDMAAWAAATSPDPLPEHRPDPADCAASGLLLEGSTFEINTGLCRYAFLEQPLLADLEPGDEVEVVMYHSDLVATEPALGHFALLVGEQVLWERFVPIPSVPDAYTDLVEVAFAASAGDPLLLHVHNHGANTWNLLRVERNPSR